MRTVIGTERMSLIALTADALDELLAGAESVEGVSIPPWWPNSDADEASMVRSFGERLRDEPSLLQWRFRLMSELDTGAMIGHCGFHDPPHDGRLELGYTVLAEHRRRGYATEAILGLMNEAVTEHGVHRFRLAISPANEPSLSLAERLGFEVVGEQIDPDDGLELLYERHWPPTRTSDTVA